MANETTIKSTAHKKPASIQSKQLIASVKAVIISFIVGIVLMLFAGYGPNIKDFFERLFIGNFGSKDGIAKFLGRLSWMIPLGLSLAVSFRIGLFNIGSAGQMIAGGISAIMFAGWAGSSEALSFMGNFGWIATILIGCLAGALVAGLIGMLKNEFGIHEVISSIMLNWIIFYLLRYMTYVDGGKFDWPSYIDMAGFSLKATWLDQYFGFSNTEFSFINIGIFISALLIIVIWFLYKKTKWGTKQELIGNNKNIGKYLGINQKAEFYKAFLFSGALAGLAGAIYATGYSPVSQLPQATITDIPALTFDGITIALLGFNGPFGILLSSALISMMSNPLLDGEIGSMHIVAVMIAVMVILMAKANFEIYYKEKKVKTKEVKTKDKSKGGSHA